jgi:hypothetical protein
MDEETRELMADLAGELPAWAGLAAAGRYEEAVLALVRKYDYVTFAELQQKLAPYLPTDGSQALTLTHENLIVWLGMSEAFCDLMQRLFREQRLFAHPSSYLSYMMDGRLPGLPLAKRPPKGGYRTPHWVPVCLRLVPLPETKGGR